eukprot:TRINITY_DN15469_c0_g1_i2.p1 TRINITY_DN15469_c0_g1~~TRINITY_DN15469_c0_g1_i2.p1  ORF type:complete len:278 (-),score=70.71 TRINITY_DN15469_c0_g1_i2:282-1115(-)
MGNSSPVLEPWSACRSLSGRSDTTETDESDAMIPQQVFVHDYMAQPPPRLNILQRGVSNANDIEDTALQEALQRSYEDHLTGGADDELQREQQAIEERELQEALAESQIYSDFGLEGRPEERSEFTERVQAVLDDLGLERMDVGSRNLNESGDMLNNQCFYLSIARSWLADAAKNGGLLVRDSALQLKREIETSVLKERGENGRRDIGEEAEAYTDFLASALCGEAAFASELAIAVFVSAAGALEAYEGRAYSRQPRHQRVANLALVWHRVGHFEAM